MSRIGKMPITVPAGVEATIEGQLITVKGPKGTLSLNAHPSMIIEFENGIINVKRPDDQKENRALHGLSRSLIANMVEGVHVGFKKTLEVNGVGYRVQKQGKNLVMNLGYSHQVIMEEPENILIEVPASNQIIISGADKQAVGEFAAKVRGKRPPEPYKGKGIRYQNEIIKRKEGKAGKGAKK